jgi:hypothetical protein
MVRNLAVQTEAAKPPVGDVEMNFLAQAPLRPNVHAVADEQHADYQFGIDQGTPGAAEERLHGGADAVETETSVIAAQLMIGGNVIINAEIMYDLSRSRMHPSITASPANQQASESRSRQHGKDRVCQRYRRNPAIDETA